MNVDRIKLCGAIGLFMALAITTQAQLSCLNCPGRDTTSYTNGAENDSLFFICQGASAGLRVFWDSGELQNVQWYRFISTSNTWLPIQLQQQVSQGSYTAATGGFRAVVTNADGEVTYDQACWVSRVNSPALVNANTLQPGCTSVQLAGLFFTGNINGYYNLPPVNFNEAYFFNENTQIEICLDIEHPIMADLRIELVSPPDCGSVPILLTDAQTPAEVDTVCFNENATNLCFSNTSDVNYFLCDFPFSSVSGTFGSYGVTPQPIDWSPLVGCDITLPGWQLNVYDCYEGAAGFITDVSIVISDDSIFTTPYTQFFVPVDDMIFSIPDSGCVDGAYGSIVFERPYPNSTFLGQNIGVQWEADPPIDFGDNANDLYIFLESGPTQDTYFTLSLTNIQLGEVCGVIPFDVEFYDYIPPDSSVIAVTDSILCLTDEPVLLQSSIQQGSWGGLVDAAADSAYFSPAEAGEGVWTISFDPVSSCIEPTEVHVYVYSAPSIALPNPPPFCNTDEPESFVAAPIGGIWSGEGIIDSLAGIFDPGQVPGGGSSITYTVGEYCPAQATFETEVEAFVPLEIVQDDSIRLCVSGPILNFDVNLPNTLWAGEGITSSSQGFFNPSAAGIGVHEVIAGYHQACDDNDTVWVVVETDAIQFVAPGSVCVNSDTLELIVEATQGIWSGWGIVDSVVGVVDPSLLVPGPHYFTYTLLNSCATADSVALMVQDFPTIQITFQDGICVDQLPIAVSANPGGGLFSGSGIAQQNAQWLFSPSEAGVGETIIQYDYTGVCTLSVIDSIEVFPLPIPVVSSDTTICPEGEAVVSVSGVVSCEWSPASSLQSPQQTLTLAQPDVTTTYTVLGESENGCFSSAEVTIAVYDSPVVTTNAPLELCFGESDVLSVSGLSNALWTGPEIESPEELSTLVAPLETSVYTVSGTDDNGCVGETTAEVIIYNPVAFFTSSDTLGVPPLDVELTNLSVGDYFVWDMGNGDTIITTELSELVSAVYQGEQGHPITLTAYLNGCPEEFSLNIVTYYDSELLIIPNVVTPNGDTKNDSWWVKTQNMEQLHVDIFNRWGNLVGVLEGINDKWNPDDAAAGSYYYRLTALGLDGETYNREGQFTVLQSDN